MAVITTGGRVYYNQQVTVTPDACAGGSDYIVVGKLPYWVTWDGTTLTGSACVFTGCTQAEANDYAQNQLQAVADSQLECFGGACAVSISTGGSGPDDAGGDTYDCYTVSAYSTGYYRLPSAGTGFTGVWAFGDSPFGYPYGEPFDEYGTTADAISSTSPPLNGGTGFGNQWRLGNNPFANPEGDSFDTYAVGAPGTLDAGTGFSGPWVLGT